MSDLPQRPWWRQPPREGALVALAALAALRLLVILIAPAVTPPQWDEFIILTNAKRIFQGAVPYRDYFNHTPPLSEWFYAAVFGLSGGPNAGVARLVTQLVIVGSALLTYGALRRLAVRPLAAALPAGALIALWFPQWPIALHHWLALLPASGALLCWTLALRGDSRQPVAAVVWAGAAGVLLVASALCVQTQALIVAATLLALPRLLRGPQPDPRAPSAGRALAALAAGGAIACGVFASYLAATGALGLFIEASVLFPLRGYRQPGGPNDLRFLADLPYRLGIFARLEAPWFVRASLAAGQICTVLAGAAVALWTVLIAGRALLEHRASSLARASFDTGVRLLPLATALACLLVRPDILHLAFYGLLPAAYAVAAAERPAGRWRYLDRCARALVAWCAAIGLIVHLGLPLAQGAGVPPVFGRVTSIDPALDGLPTIDAEMVQRDVRLHFLRRYGVDHPGARLFAASQGAVLYFFGLPPAVSRTLLYAPGVPFHTPWEYWQILAQLMAQPPELVVFTPAAEAEQFLRPPPVASTAVQELSRFLGARYQPMVFMGDALLMLRRQDMP